MRTLLKQILEQLNRITDVLELHNKVLRMLLDESIAKDKKIFEDEESKND